MEGQIEELPHAAVPLDTESAVEDTSIFGRIKYTFSSTGEWIAVDFKDKGLLALKLQAKAEQIARSKPAKQVSSFTKFVMNKLPKHYNYAALFLVVLGFLTALVGVMMDLIISEIGILKMMAAGPKHSSYVAAYFLAWLVFTIGLLLLGVLVTDKISPTATGSGIPEMKAILSGISLSEYLSTKTLFAKVLGLIFAVGSGASLGKEGPLVHNSCIIANQLAKLTLFERIRKNPTLMQQMLGVACSVGIAANLGAPIGGVLFSIEVTSTYYPLRNYWFAYLGSIVGALTLRWIWNLRWNLPWLTAIAPTQFIALDFTWLELIVFCILGILCSLFGVLFIKLSFYCKDIYNKIPNKGRFFSGPYGYALVIGIITSFLTFPHFIGDYMGIDPLKALHDLFHRINLLDNTSNAVDWDSPNVFITLLIFFFIKFFLTAISISMRVPAGLLIPLFAAGAALGRFVGEVLRVQVDPTEYNIVPGGWAVVGSAALVASVTQTLSTAVIMLEITGQINYLLPILLAVIVSVGVSRKISSLSIYDSIAQEKKLPYLPDLQQMQYEVRAKDIMRVDQMIFLTKDMHYEDIKSALHATEYRDFPVVDNQESMLLVGKIDREVLAHAFKEAKDTVLDPNLLIIDSVPVQISPDTPLTQIHMLFITMRLFHCFVTDYGKLVGIISRHALKETVEKQDSVLTYLQE